MRQSFSRKGTSTFRGIKVVYNDNNITNQRVSQGVADLKQKSRRTNAKPWLSLPKHSISSVDVAATSPIPGADLSLKV